MKISLNERKALHTLGGPRVGTWVDGYADDVRYKDVPMKMGIRGTAKPPETSHRKIDDEDRVQPKATKSQKSY